VRDDCAVSLPHIVDDRPPSDGAHAGWRAHPQHPTVERYWDGTRWTGEHRFAPLVYDADARALAAAERDDAATRTGWQPRPGWQWLAAAFGVPWAYLAGGVGLADTVDDCSGETQAWVAAGVGLAMVLWAAAAAERGLRLLDVRMWLRVVVVTFSAMYSFAFVFAVLAAISIASFCWGC